MLTHPVFFFDWISWHGFSCKFHIRSIWTAETSELIDSPQLTTDWRFHLNLCDEGFYYWNSNFEMQNRKNMTYWNNIIFVIIDTISKLCFLQGVISGSGVRWEITNLDWRWETGACVSSWIKNLSVVSCIGASVTFFCKIRSLVNDLYQRLH